MWSLVSLELPDSANKNTGHPLTFEFQINNEYIFSMSYCDDQNILKCVVHYVKFKFNWVSCILSGKCCDLWLLREWGWGWDELRSCDQQTQTIIYSTNKQGSAV